MKIVVTGASGFLGVPLCRALRDAGHDVRGLDSRSCDLRLDSSLDRLAAGPADMIFHLAAWTQAGDFCLHHPGEQWIVNQRINTNVIDWWSRLQPGAKLVFMGTSCAYATDGALTEDEYLRGEPTPSLYTYAMTKRMLYQGARALHQQFGLRYLCAVPSTLYGPGYHTDGRQMHFIFDLIRKILRGREYGEEVVLWGDGLQRREVIHVDDFVAALLRLAPRVDNDIVNIGAGEEHTIRHFAHRICALVGYPFERIRFDTSRYVGARSKCLDIAKLRLLLPDYSPRSLDAGLESTIAWFTTSRAYRA